MRQPWAGLIAHGVKNVETRTWAPKGLVGRRIAIHAGKRRINSSELHPDTLAEARLAKQEKGEGAFPLGAVVATAVLEAVWQVESWEKTASGQIIALGSQNKALVDAHGDFRPGRWLWILTDVGLLNPPVEIRGWQGLWEWTPPH